MRINAWAAALLLITGCSGPDSPFESSDLFLTGVSIIDTVTGELLHGHTVVIRDERILAVEPSSGITVPMDARVLASGGYVVPGLWDMHMHALSDPDDAINRALPLLIANGITGIRDMASLLPGIAETRARLAADPELPAPDLYVSGLFLDGAKLPWYGDLPLVLDSAEAAEREVPKLVDAGVDFFKVYEQLPSDAYAAVIELAKNYGMPVAGHAPQAIGLSGAAQAGQRSIEHLSIPGLRDCITDPDDWFNRSINAKFTEGYDAYYQVIVDFAAAIDRPACQAAFKQMAQSGTFFTPTLVMEFNDRTRIDPQAIQYLPAASRDWCETTLQGTGTADPERRESAYAVWIELLGMVRNAGVRLLAGSDSANFCLTPGDSLHWELQRLVEAGLSPLEALQTATLNAAAAMDREDELGRVSAGYRADLLVLAENPLEDIRHLRQFAGVMRNGQWLEPEKLAQLKSQALAYAQASVREDTPE